jgi:hypothetical protein
MSTATPFDPLPNARGDRGYPTDSAHKTFRDWAVREAARLYDRTPDAVTAGVQQESNSIAVEVRAAVMQLRAQAEALSRLIIVPEMIGAGTAVIERVPGRILATWSSPELSLGHRSRVYAFEGVTHRFPVVAIVREVESGAIVALCAAASETGIPVPIPIELVGSEFREDGRLLDGCPWQ